MTEIRPATEKEQLIDWLEEQILLHRLTAKATQIGRFELKEVGAGDKRIGIYSPAAFRALAVAAERPVMVRDTGESPLRYVLSFTWNGYKISAYVDDPEAGE